MPRRAGAAQRPKASQVAVGARRSRRSEARCCPATLSCSARPGLQAGTAQRARRMRLESPASPPVLSRKRESEQCPTPSPACGRASNARPPLPPAGERAMPGPLSRLRERVGVRVFGCRNDIVPHEFSGHERRTLSLSVRRLIHVLHSCFNSAALTSPTQLMNSRACCIGLMQLLAKWG